MTKTVDKTTAIPGDTLQYKVTLTNNQPNSDNNVSVQDFLPAGVTLVGTPTATQGTVDATGNPIVWTVGDIASGATVVLTINVTIDAGVSTPLRNRASKVTGAQPFVPPDNQCAQTGPTQHDACVTTTVIPAGTYELTKDVSRSTAAPGDHLVYTVSALNAGDADLPGIVVLDTLPVGVSLVSVNPGPPATTVVDGTVRWEIGTLAAHTIETMTIEVTVNPDAPRTLINRAAGIGGPVPVVPPDNQCGSSEEEQHEACATTTVELPANLTIVKRADESIAAPGQTVRYTISVTNNGEQAVGFVTLGDNLSDVLDDATYNNDAHTVPDGRGTLTFTSPNLVWTNGALAAHETVDIIYTVTVNKPDTGNHRLFNTVSSTTRENNCPPTETVGARQIDPRCSALVRVADLHIVKRADRDWAKPGERVRYTIEVTNRGQINYSGSNAATLFDDLSRVLDNARYNGDARASTGTVLVRDDRLAWRGDLIPGEQATITYSVTVHSSSRPHDGGGCVQARGEGQEHGCDGRDGHHKKKLKLINKIESPTPGSNCGRRSDDPDCLVVVRVAVRHHGNDHGKDHGKEHGREHGPQHGEPGLAYTGAANVTPLAVSGFGLLAGGGLLLLVSARLRRRRTEV